MPRAAAPQHPNPPRARHLEPPGGQHLNRRSVQHLNSPHGQLLNPPRGQPLEPPRLLSLEAPRLLRLEPPRALLVVLAWPEVCLPQKAEHHLRPLFVPSGAYLGHCSRPVSQPAARQRVPASWNRLRPSLSFRASDDLACCDDSLGLCQRQAVDRRPLPAPTAVAVHRPCSCTSKPR